ncbi:MAG: hypothetical protein HC927_03310 [Deltaproteobacteria bacterium]|nr:hypothetical protein [Deltaproteobacteria bacterium]
MAAKELARAAARNHREIVEWAGDQHSETLRDGGEAAKSLRVVVAPVLNLAAEKLQHRVFLEQICDDGALVPHNEVVVVTEELKPASKNGNALLRYRTRATTMQTDESGNVDHLLLQERNIEMEVR